MQAFSAQTAKSRLHGRFIFKIHGLNDGKNRIVDVAFLFFVEVFYVDGGAVLDNDVGLFDPREMGLPDLVGIVDADGDDGTA